LLLVPAFLDEAEESTHARGDPGARPPGGARYKEYTAKRRVASFGAGYDFDENELTPAPVIAPFLLPLRARVGAWLGIPPENSATRSSRNIGPARSSAWHRDVPHFEVVAGVSLGGRATMRFRPFPPRKGARHPDARARTAIGLRHARRGSLGLAAQHRADPGATLLHHFPHRRVTAA
jgi:hypothetical protein